MKRKIQGFTLIELIITISIIAIIATVTVVAYSGLTTRARNAATVESVSNYVKVLQSYRTKHGSYPLQQYTNSRFDSSHFDPDIDLDGQTGEKYTSTLILNHPSAIRPPKSTESSGLVKHSPSNPDLHGLAPTGHFAYRPGYLDYGPPVTAASQSQVQNPRDWSYYADYLTKLFKGFDLPAAYNDSNRLIIKDRSSHEGKELVTMGFTYYLIHRPHSDKTSAFLSYALRGDTSCGITTVRRTYVRYDNITICSVQIPD